MVYRDQTVLADRDDLEGQVPDGATANGPEPTEPPRAWQVGDDPTTHPRWADQFAKEYGQLREGAAKVAARTAKLTRKKQMTELGPVRALLNEFLPIVAKGVRKLIAEAKKRKGGPEPIALPYLDPIDPFVAALIALRCILDGMTVERMNVTALAIEIGTELEHEMQVRLWEKEAPDLFYKTELGLNLDQATAIHRRKVHIAKFNEHLKEGRFGFGWQPWGHEVRFRVGAMLVSAVVEFTGWFRIEDDITAADKKRNKWHKVPKILVPDAAMVAKIGEDLDRLEELSPALKPTLMPPKRWEGTRKGGYYTPYVMTPRLIRFKASQEDQKERAADEYEAIDMPEVYEAIHTLQEVPWKVNRKVLEVAKVLWSRDRSEGSGEVGLAGLPRLHFELPTRSGAHEAHLALRYEARKKQAHIDRVNKSRRDEDKLPDIPMPVAEDDLQREMLSWMRKAKSARSRNAKVYSRTRQASTTLNMAMEFAWEPCFYFPHMLDFRGRMYPIPTGLQPQGSDLARGLLDFAEGKAIETPQAQGWLAISVANHWGNDKVSLSERIAWVYEREDLWRRIASDPLGNLEWAQTTGPDKVSSPFQALAAILDWVAFLDHGMGYVSHRPCVVDGTCNGIQHLSAMVRDPVAGALVNLTPNERPQDIYQDVADRLLVEVKRKRRHARGEYAFCKFWLDIAEAHGGKFPRAMTKRPTMVLPYGGTGEATFKYLMEWLNEYEPLPDDCPKSAWQERAHCVGWLGRLLVGVLADAVSGGVKVMEWLRKCAEAVTEGNQPIFWVAPDGMVVRHFYGEVVERQVKTKLLGETVRLWVETHTRDLDKESQLRGVPPNFTHSIDASCLVTTINTGTANGITAFTAVHDAYGTHAADMETLYAVTRHAFVETHQHDILGIFRDGCARVLVDMGKAKGMDELDAVAWAESKLPAPLPMGDLDITAVMESDYFFA